jgi:DNA repair exonuclease SbcCD ATPase subunit
MVSLREWLNGSRDYAIGARLYRELGKDPLLLRMFSEPESDFKKKKLAIALQDLWDSRKMPKNGLYNRNPEIKRSPEAAAMVAAKRKSAQDALPAIHRALELHKTKMALKDLTKQAKQLEETREEHESTIEDLEWEKSDLEDKVDELDEKVGELSNEVEDLADENRKLKKAKSRNGWPVAMDETMKALHAQWKEKFLAMVDLQSRIYEVGRAGIKDLAKEKEAGTMALQILDLRDEVIAIYKKRDYYIEHNKLPEEPTAVDDCLDPKLWPVKLQNAQRYVREYNAQLKQMDPSSNKYIKKLQKRDQWQTEVDKYKTLLKLD